MLPLFDKPELGASPVLGLIPPRHFWRFGYDFREWWWWRESGCWLELDENDVDGAVACLPEGIVDLTLYGVQVTGRLLDGLAERYQGLRKLSLYRCHGSGELAGSVALCFPELEHVAFRGSNLDDDGLRSVVAVCGKLSSLDVYRSAVTDVGIGVIADGLPALERLSVGWTEITDVGGLEIASKLTGLRALEFREVEVNELSTYRAMVEGLACLEELDLWRQEDALVYPGLVLSEMSSLRSLNLGANLLSDHEVSAIVERLPGLERLWVGPCDLTSRVIEGFAGLEQLELLAVESSRLSPGAAVSLCSNLPSSLRFLKMNDNRGLGDAPAAKIAESFPDLVHLDLAACDVGPSGASALADSLGSLRYLNLTCSGGLVDDAAAVRIGQGLTELVELRLAGCRVGDVGVAGLAEGLRQLRWLDVGGNGGITDRGVQAIAEHLQELRVLILGGTRVGDVGAVAIAESLALVEHLNLSNVRLSPSTLDALNNRLSRLDKVTL